MQNDSNGSEDKIQMLIELIVQALSYAYKGDKTKPGLLISYVKDEFYVSAHRYKKPFGNDKEVIYKAYNKSLEDALIEIATDVTKEKPEEDPIDKLDSFLKTQKPIVKFGKVIH